MKCNYKKTMEANTLKSHQKSFSSEKLSVLSYGETYTDFIGCPDGINITTMFGGLTLLATFQSPTKQEIEEFRFGNLEIALADDNSILITIIKLGKLNWTSSAVNYSLEPNAYNLSSNNNIFNMLMFDTSTGELVAMRTLGLHLDFVREIQCAIKKQLEIPYSLTEFREKVKHTYSKFPTEEHFLKKAFFRYNFFERAKSNIK